MRGIAVCAGMALLAACGARVIPSGSGSACDSDAACDFVKAKYDLGRFAQRDRRSKTFDSAGTAYHLVQFAWGAGEDCPSGCIYSRLCTFVVGSNDVPSMFEFAFRSEWIFDPTSLCPSKTAQSYVDSAGCDMPASHLPLMKDVSFRAWLASPPDPSDELRWCRGS